MAVSPELQDRPKAEAALLDAAGALTAELHPGAGTIEVTLDSRIDRDLGLDSLARLELLGRLERRFGVRLDEREVILAETARDLFSALLAAAGLERAAAPPAGIAAMAGWEPEIAFPAGPLTLMDVLERHVAAHPDRPHLHLLDEDDATVTYADLLAGARSVAGGLAERRLAPGSTVALMLPTGRDYFFSFFGILLAGCVPVPIYPPMRPGQLADHLARQAGILANAGTRFLVTDDAAKAFGRLLRARVPALREVLTAADLRASGLAASAPARTSRDCAILQYTSGSTGRPKGVVLSHDNIVANIRAMGRTLEVGPQDLFASWLPLYHDMGLIGAWLGSLYFAMPLAVMAPLSFLARPERWLQAIHRYRASLSAAPNFAFELCVQRIPDAALAGLDLRSLRLLLNGAEPVSPDTIARFAARFGPCGFDPKALTPVYGLAESSVGLAFTPPGRGPLVDRVRREPFMRSGRAEPAELAEPASLRFVSCGRPLPAHDVRIVDEAGRELPDRHVGRLEFRGPSATSGYFNSPEATARLFHEEWLDSGDLGYVAAGEVYVTGRVKDLIIRAGRNIVPHELEETVGDLSGVRKGCVAAFPSPDPATGTERLVIVAETRLTRPEDLAALRKRIQALTVDLLGLPPDDTVLAGPHAVPKTSSGKIRRSECRERYERGELLTGTRGPLGVPERAWLLADLAAAWLRRAAGRIGEVGYGAWAWLVFEILAIGVLPLLLLPLPVSWRWGLLRAGGRLLVPLLGLSVAVRDRRLLPERGPFVVVANHASYLDAFALTIALGADLAFVATRQLLGQPIPRAVLPLLGVVFVEPRDPARARDDVRTLDAALQAGRALAIFPEGGLAAAEGLRAFHLGAFLVAAQAGVPVVPVAMRGTRAILPPFTWLPRRGSVELVIGEPIEPGGRDWDAAMALRERARSHILRHCGEPDLERRAARRGDPGQVRGE